MPDLIGGARATPLHLGDDVSDNPPAKVVP